MTRIRLLILGASCLVVSAAIAAPVVAQCINPTTFPETIEVRMGASETQLILGNPFSGGATLTAASVSGNLLSLDLEYFDACAIGVPPAPQPVTVSLGFVLAPGTYDVRVRNRALGSATVFEVSRTLVVSGSGVGASAAVPALSTAVMLIFALAMGAFGLTHLRGISK